MLEHQIALFIPERPLDRHLRIAEVLVVEYLAELRLGEVAIEPGNLGNGRRRDVVALVAQRFAALLEQAIRVDKLHLALAARTGFLVRQHPDIGCDAGIVEDIVGQRDDRLEQIALQEVAPYLGWTAARVAGEQR